MNQMNHGNQTGRSAVGARGTATSAVRDSAMSATRGSALAQRAAAGQTARNQAAGSAVPFRASYSDLYKRVQTLKTLQTQPAIIAKITSLLQNPATNAEELGAAIRTDPVLSSSVLKLVNSAFYGFPGRIGSISHAVVLLGFSTVKNIVLTASVMDIFKTSGVNVNTSVQDIWKHSLACGASAQSIARYIGFDNKEAREECFIAGLLHDIGKAIMFQLLPGDIMRVIEGAEKTRALFYDTECKLLGVNHQEIGGMLVEQWRLPAQIQNSVTEHHNPSAKLSDESKVVAIVHCADIFARALGYGGGDKKIPLVSDAAWDMLELDRVDLPRLFDTIESELSKTKSMFQL